LAKPLPSSFSKRGARKVYAGARDPASVRLSGVQPVKLDITNANDAEAAAKALGGVTLLFNNAGIAPTGTLAEDQSLEIARTVMETNYFGTLRMCGAFAPILGSNGGGALINMLSALSWITMAPLDAYCASKAAEWSLTNAVRAQGAEDLSDRDPCRPDRHRHGLVIPRRQDAAGGDRGADHRGDRGRELGSVSGRHGALRQSRFGKGAAHLSRRLDWIPAALSLRPAPEHAVFWETACNQPPSRHEKRYGVGPRWHSADCRAAIAFSGS
jgi:hypothetical protein